MGRWGTTVDRSPGRAWETQFRQVNWLEQKGQGKVGAPSSDLMGSERVGRKGKTWIDSRGEAAQGGEQTDSGLASPAPLLHPSRMAALQARPCCSLQREK